MFTVARKSEANEIALARGIVVAEPVVGKIVQLIVAEIENCDRLARARLLRSVSLIEQRGIAFVGLSAIVAGKLLVRAR